MSFTHLSMTLLLSQGAGAQVQQRMSIDWERSAEGRQAIESALKKRREQEEESQQKTMQGLTEALGKMGGGGSGGSGASRKKSRRKPASTDSAEVASSSTGTFTATGGGMEACGSLPANVAKNLQELQDFRKACKVADTGGNQKFAINDYSCKNGQPMMYLFDTNGTCEKKMPITFGRGKGAADNSCPRACSTDKTHLTPPGFHLTAPHAGAKYGPNNSLLLVGLEGQGSANRKILIHGAQNPGTASSWGCTGVGEENLMAVLNYLRNGALVYNAFDPSQLTCNSRAGLDHDASSCRKDPGAPAAHPYSSAGATTSQ